MEKILFVINKLGGGGAERVATILANEFVVQGKEVKFVVFNRLHDTYEISNIIKCEYLETKNKANFLKKIERIIKLRKKIKEYEPNSIIAFEYFVNMQTIIANLGLKYRLIVSERNDPSKVGNKKKKLRNFLYRFVNVLVCQTNQAKEYFPKYIQRKTVIILNPINNNLPSPWRGKRNKEIVSFCRIEKQKNLPLLIDAFEKVHRKYPDYVLNIYGDGSEKDYIREYIENKYLTSCVNLYPATKNIHNKVLKSSMFVSSSNYEGMSNSMIEAMAIGLPTICTDCPCGGARMVIKNEENGLLVPTENVESLKISIDRLIEDKELSEKLSKNAIKIRESLKISKIIYEWEKIIF